MDRRIVKLSSPVTHGTEVIEELAFRKGRLGDLRGCSVAQELVIPVADLIMVASRMCGQPMKVIESLESRDAAEVMSIATDFWVGCLSTGSAPSAT